MLERKDLEAIREIVNDSIAAKTPGIVNAAIEAKTPDIVNSAIESKGPEIVSPIVEREDRRLAHMLLSEMERNDAKYEMKFKAIQEHLKKLNDMYWISRNESDTIHMLIKRLDEYEKRLSVLEIKTA